MKNFQNYSKCFEMDEIEGISKNTPIDDRKKSFALFMLQKNYKDIEHFNTVFSKSTNKFRLSISKTELYDILQGMGKLSHQLMHFCVHKSSKSHSGVCVISTIMAPEMHFEGKKGQKFTCKYDCAFCPNDPTQARSYPRDEPVPLRGSQNGFDVVRQAHSRMKALNDCHHTVDKLEWLVLGGTWSSFPKEYREFYHCSIIFAANLWAEGINVCDLHTNFPHIPWRDNVRPMKSIEEEIAINRKGRCRVIGITIETRPDEINLAELRFMRDLGVTRIQMGFQHTDNEILKKNRRGCSIETCMKGLRIALENGFKVDGHWMPDLPGSNPEKDKEMITRAFTDENLRCDQIKIYPTQVLDFTLIKKWYDEGDYRPYGEFDFNSLLELLIYAKSIIPPWVRTNRIVRDFPNKIIKGGLSITHLHDMIQNEMKKRGIFCNCIRCREVARQIVDYEKAETIVRTYISAGGTEYFVSYEIPNDTGGILLGFCRLRLNNKDLDPKRQFPELYGCALIRELHVYGNTTSEGSEYTQHRGIGKMLLEKVEYIAREEGWKKIAVISGIGVQDYYLRRGYQDGFYMIKNL